MSNQLQDQYWIVWNDPSDNLDKYFALSSETGHYWTTDVDDPNIVDGLSLDIVYTPEDTIKQIAEKWRMQKGKAYERKNLFQHPNEKAWLCVEKKPCGPKNPDTGKIPREYKAFWSRKFKSVVCISNITGQRQGNPSMNDKDYAKKNSAKAREERKRRLATAQETAKKLNFDPMKRLALYAMGDSDRLGLREEVKQSVQMKALETYLKYSHQQMKPYSPQEMDKLRQDNSGPRINIVLPSDGSENKQHVLEHKDEQSLEEYLRTGSVDSYKDIEDEIGIDPDDNFEKEYAFLDLPKED